MSSVIRSGFFFVCFRRRKLVFRTADLGGDRARNKDLIVKIQLRYAFLYNFLLIIRVENRKILLITDQIRMASQDPREHGVKGSYPHISGHIPDQGPDALFHLARGFVRKRNRQNLRRPYMPYLNQICNAKSNDSCLARSGSGQNQERSFVMTDRLFLFGIQTR